ncbi:MAG: hypothetical protein Q8N26_06200 [Myxococcales bacterium]|nr:hypothetical protein [Myxococcales bacterium]
MNLFATCLCPCPPARHSAHFSVLIVGALLSCGAPPFVAPGELCQNDSDCEQTQFCGQFEYCTSQCSADRTCPSGFVCASSECARIANKTATFSLGHDGTFTIATDGGLTFGTTVVTQRYSGPLDGVKLLAQLEKTGRATVLLEGSSTAESDCEKDAGVINLTVTSVREGNVRFSFSLDDAGVVRAGFPVITAPLLVCGSSVAGQLPPPIAAESFSNGLPLAGLFSTPTAFSFQGPMQRELTGTDLVIGPYRATLVDRRYEASLSIVDVAQ